MQKLLKPAVFITALIPFFVLVLRVMQNDLGPDPAQELAKETGEWTLRFLLLTLALTPLRQLTGKPQFVRIRRMVGLFTLFYATVHFLAWMSFLLAFRWVAIGEELVQRPFITVGFAAYLILLALGITSPQFMVRKLGKNWKKLHRTIYLAAILGVIHLLWILRTDVGEAAFYGLIVAILLGFRVLKNRKPAAA